VARPFPAALAERRRESDLTAAANGGRHLGRVAGKVALVTGGASGLGRATAVLLAREGAKVAVADRNRQGAEQAAAEIGAGAIAIALDVTDEQQWIGTIARVLAAFGRFNVLVHSAGVAVLKDVEATSYAEWRLVHGVNLDGVFLGCKHALPAMRPHAPGSIVVISSVSGLVAGHNTAAYNASKAGARLLSKSVALHCARQGDDIRCNSVHPTFIDTPMVEGMLRATGDPARAREKLVAQIPLRRLGAPDDVAYGILYLASDESRFMTGAELVLDGGLTAM
jgi:3(or 17)beta-hydroxysteroid dehydrogenase